MAKELGVFAMPKDICEELMFEQVISDEDAGYNKPESLFAYCMEMVVKPDLSALDYVRVALFLLTLTG